nr:immunoglobulin light chain junction region [Macaca mulatta]
CLQYIHIPFTF